jgi:hypothetical protein
MALCKYYIFIYILFFFHNNFIICKKCTIKNNRCDIILDYIHTTGKTTRKTIGTKINRMKYLIINPSGILLNSQRKNKNKCSSRNINEILKVFKTTPRSIKCKFHISTTLAKCQHKYYNSVLLKNIRKRHIYENTIHSMQLILFKEKKHDFMYILWINKEHVDFLFINNEHVGVLFIDTKSTSTPLNFDIQTRKITNNRINTTKFNNVINKINTIITTTTIIILSNNKTMTYRDSQLRRKHKCISTVNTRNSPIEHACKLPDFIDHEKLISSVKHKKHNYIPCIVHLYKIMLKNCPSKTHESPSKQNIVTVRKIHMVNKFTVSRVKAVQVNTENDKILLIAIGNVLKNKYIHIVNNIVCVFQMRIIMQILSMYVITDKQKDVSHDVIMVKCYKFCYYLYIHVHRGIFLLPILPNFHYYAYYYKLQANIR